MVDISILQDAGVLGTIAIGMGILIRWQIQKNAAQIDTMIQRNFAQADATLDMARTTISQNTRSLDQTVERLDQMGELLINNIKQKESLVTAIHEQTAQLIAKLEGWKQNKDKQFRDILKRP